MSSGSCGRNSCSGGSSRRIVTGSPRMISKSSTKSARCIGSSRSSAACRSASVSARIISRITVMRAASKNMCSVRQSPRPSTRKSRAIRASAGVSALARTPRSRTASAQSSSSEKAPPSSGGIIAGAPAITSPRVPSRVMRRALAEDAAVRAGQRARGGVEAQLAGADDAGQRRCRGRSPRRGWSCRRARSGRRGRRACRGCPRGWSRAGRGSSPRPGPRRPGPPRR